MGLLPPGPLRHIDADLPDHSGLPGFGDEPPLRSPRDITDGAGDRGLAAIEPSKNFLASSVPELPGVVARLSFVSAATDFTLPSRCCFSSLEGVAAPCPCLRVSEVPGESNDLGVDERCNWVAVC